MRSFKVLDTSQETLQDTIEETQCPEEVTVSKNCCCNSSFSQSCPEGSDVTINITNIKVEDSELKCAHEILTFTNRETDLTYRPLSSSCVEIHRNGLLQNPGTCYNLFCQGQHVIITDDPHADDTFVATYKYLADQSSTDASSRIGLVDAWAGNTATIPANSLLADGSSIGNVGSGADFEGEKYRDLYVKIGNNYDTTGSPPTPDFDGGVVLELPNANDLFQQGALLVQLPAIIWFKDD